MARNVNLGDVALLVADETAEVLPLWQQDLQVEESYVDPATLPCYTFDANDDNAPHTWYKLFRSGSGAYCECACGAVRYFEEW